MGIYKKLLMSLCLIFSVAGCRGCGNQGTPAGGISPVVVSTSPLDAAINVAINKKIAATFSEEMYPLTSTTTTSTTSATTYPPGPVHTAEEMNPIMGTTIPTATPTTTTAFYVTGPGSTPVEGTVAMDSTNRVAVFTPATNLAINTLFTATITTEAMDFAGDTLASNYVWTFTTGETADYTAPTVIGTINVDGAINVPINTNAGATFSEEMDPTTITDLTFVLEGPDGTPVLGELTYSGVNAVFNPTSNLAINTLYTATITTGVTDLAGNAMETNYVWSWTTGETEDITAPTVIGTINADGAINVPINTNAGATFSEVMDPTTITNLTFTLEAPVGTPVLGEVSYAGVNAVFNPSSDLAPGTLYTATITTGAKDLAGNALASNYVWSWTTGGGADTTAPTVDSTNPADLDTDVAINRVINATFSEAMDPVTLTTPGHFTLTRPGPISVAGAVTYDLVTDVATFALLPPGTNLLPNTTYTATITTAAQDLANNPLAVDYVWTFTTGAGDFLIGAPQASVVLGRSGRFAILASAAVTDIPPSVITGDVGLTPDAGSKITGFSVPLVCPEVTLQGGNIFAVDATGPGCAIDETSMADPTTGLVNPTLIEDAKTDALAAFTDAFAAGRGVAQDITPIELGGLTLYPGLYESLTTIELHGDLYLDAQGDSNAVFVIRSSNSITTFDPSEVHLTKGAKATNVYWSAGSAVTLGAHSIMKGTIIAGTAITLQTLANLEGRALNQGPAAAAITCDSCTITVPAP